MFQAQYEKSDYVLSSIERQSYLYKNKFFSQELLSFEEDKERYVSFYLFILNYNVLLIFS
jgi:hypothetical protein